MTTQNKIIEWALKAGALIGRPLAPHEFSIHSYTFSEVELNRFANFAMQYQKEKDAQICEELRVHYGNGDPDGDECAAAIRNQE